ncbi:protein EDS1L-like [Gastrolobium bilobum]|uniref:protein EDS1L-like n=1 Tax=Gastrolobium bilobum TaxID=150636 RepID=UPI002AB05FFA|nr:protein EDS1L-like [Gastrolobium bilobum]
MAGGSIGDKIGLKEELIKKACSFAFKAHKLPQDKYYLLEKIRTSSEANLIISFSGSWDAADWFVSKPFGETKIDLELFPSLRSIGNDEPALVNEAFLKRFNLILGKSSIKSEVNKAMTEGKQIIFTGHSSGAAVAILATFWALEEYLNPTKNQNHKPPFCVTFGSPLVGNHIFSHASRRENWSSYFIHFVKRYDIVPRIFLTPCSSIEQNFSSILQSFTPKYKASSQDSIRRGNVTCEFYSTVMRNAATVTSHAACTLMGSTNLLLETVTNFVDLSPYRPFGKYIFCNGNGQLIVISNSDAVLQLLFHTAQLSDLAELSEVASKSILEHLAYEDELQDSLEMQNVVYLDQLEDLPLSADGSNSDIATTSTALDGLGLSTRARLCLRAAGELQKQKNRNEEKISKEIKEKAQGSMGELEAYKATCEIHTGKGYYYAFKVQKEGKDFQANVKRLVLAGVWDEIIEMLKRYELPDEFEGKQEWIKLGTSFRRLVEPLDIANYYRHSKDEDTGPYMDKGRPKRYRYTQRWLEHANRVTKGVISESSFWAEMEELCRWNSNKKPFEGIKERVVQLEQGIKKWIDKGELTKNVFLKDPTFVKWWETLPEEYKVTSCIGSLITLKV